jgi:hypothetical protein
MALKLPVLCLLSFDRAFIHFVRSTILPALPPSLLDPQKTQS